MCLGKHLPGYLEREIIPERGNDVFKTKRHKINVMIGGPQLGQAVELE